MASISESMRSPRTCVQQWLTTSPAEIKGVQILHLLVCVCVCNGLYKICGNIPREFSAWWVRRWCYELFVMCGCIQVCSFWLHWNPASYFFSVWDYSSFSASFRLKLGLRISAFVLPLCLNLLNSSSDFDISWHICPFWFFVEVWSQLGIFTEIWHFEFVFWLYI